MMPAGSAIRNDTMIESDMPVLGFVAPSGTGKTTLLRALIPLLRRAGLRVGVVKHTHHDFEIDVPGKDSYELRKAGASEMLLASGTRWALISERDDGGDPDLAAVLGRFDRTRLDLVLVEGFRGTAIPKIELHRAAAGRDFLYPGDPDVIALATDQPPAEGRPITLLDINSAGTVAAFVLAWMREGDASREQAGARREE